MSVMVALMSAITLEEATEFYTAAKTAYLKALEGENYSISTGGSSRSFKRQTIEKLRADMEYWAAECSRLSQADPSIKVRYGYPI